jgi:hypothetical protein
LHSWAYKFRRKLASEPAAEILSGVEGTQRFKPKLKALTIVYDDEGRK